jgi:integrase
VFPRGHEPSALNDEFARMQKAAGKSLPCHGTHEHTPACHVYGFHDLRRAVATMNSARLSADDLKSLMRHRSCEATKRYFNLTRQLDEAVNVLPRPGDTEQSGRNVGFR